MPETALRVECVEAGKLQIETLPDGTTAIFDTRTQTVHSLNETAAAVFRGCCEAGSVAAVAQRTGLAGSVVLNAIAELERAGLVRCSEPVEASATRRALLRAAGAAVPVVLSLGASEQKALAQAAGSGTTTTTSTTTTSTTTTSTTTTTTSTTTTTTTTTTTPAPGPARLVSVTPNSIGNCAVAVDVEIIGENTHFSDLSMIIFSAGGGVPTVVSMTVNSPTSISARIRLTGGNTGPRNLLVVTGEESAVGAGFLNVIGC